VAGTRVADGIGVSKAAKPVCKLDKAENLYSVLFRVRDALKAAGREREACEFLRRAQRCRCHGDLYTIVAEYVVIEWLPEGCSV
jgi:hypothetical protein